MKRAIGLTVAVFLTVLATTMLAAAYREWMVHKHKGPDKLTELAKPYLRPSPGRFPGEQRPPRGPYMQAEVESVELRPSGALAVRGLIVRVRLTSKNELGTVRLYGQTIDSLVRRIVFWSAGGEPVRIRIDHTYEIVPARGPLIQIDERGKEVEGFFALGCDFVKGNPPEAIASGDCLRYLVRCRLLPFHEDAQDGLYDIEEDTSPHGDTNKGEVRIWGQGQVAFVRR